MKVLSTKSLDEAIIAQARSLGLDMEYMDFIETVRKDFDVTSVKTGFDSEVFTSANAVKYFFENKGAAELLSNRNIFSLSGKTQEELHKHDLNAILVEENAADLADAIIQSKSSKSVLHIAGNLTLDTLEKKLKAAGIDYNRLVVYQTILKGQKLTDADFDVIMFYSPSGIEGFFTNNEFDDQVTYCCIGNTTANALKGKYSDAKIILPLHPTPESMLDAIYQLTKPAIKP